MVITAITRYLLRTISPFNKNTKQENIRILIEDSGPLFIKFGQILSTRLDLLSPKLSKELIKLQDTLPPFSSKKSKAIIEKAFKKNINDIFLKFDEAPLASASISQVHSAVTLDGDSVVVKLLRPKIKTQVKKNIKFLKKIAFIIELLLPFSKQFKPKEIVKELEKTVLNELDLLRDAANASQLRRNFNDSEILYVPKIYWDLCRTNILVMEKLDGIPVSDIKQLKQYNIDLKELSERGVKIFFTQVFKHCFFHADMHPGNVWVSKNNPNNPQYLALDFGIIGTLSPIDQKYLSENFIAFFNRDYRKVAKLHIESNWVPQNTRVDELESAIRTVCEPIFERPLKDISFGKVLLKLLQTAKQFNMQIQPQLLLLQKTLINVEGLGRQLYPDLNLWQTAKPFLENWLKSKVNKKILWKNIKTEIPHFIEKLPQLPNLILDNNLSFKPNKTNSNIINNNINPILAFLLGITTTLSIVFFYLLYIRY